MILNFFKFLYKIDITTFSKTKLNDGDIAIILRFDGLAGVLLGIGITASIYGSLILHKVAALLALTSSFLLFVGILFGILFLGYKKAPLKKVCWYFSMCGILIFVGIIIYVFSVILIYIINIIKQVKLF